MEDATDTTRYPRTLTATDTEWRRIRERAEAAGMPISRFICQRAAGPEPRPRAMCERMPGSEFSMLEALDFLERAARAGAKERGRGPETPE